MSKRMDERVKAGRDRVSRRMRESRPAKTEIRETRPALTISSMRESRPAKTECPVEKSE